MASRKKQAESNNSSRFQYKAMMALAKKLRPIFSSGADGDALCVATVGLTALAHAGVIPAALANSPMQSLIRRYCADAGLSLPSADDTGFAVAGSAIFQRVFVQAEQELTPASVEAIVRIMLGDEENMRKQALYSPEADGDCGCWGATGSLDAAWMKQCLTKLRQKQTVATAALHSHKSRAQPADLPELTQWFTPEWVGEFLIEQSILDRQDATFLDPAVGAGHLLVAAWQRLAALRKNKVEAVHHILERQLFGIDIDEHMIELANFAIYLEVRKCWPEEAFPAPHVYVICHRDESRSSLGSLLMAGKEKESENVFLRSSLAPQLMQPLNAIPNQFDVVAMNPPYLSHRSIPEHMSAWLAKNYTESRYDLYAAFLDLGVQLLAPGGRLATICQQSFLTVQRYHGLRSKILAQAKLQEVVQLGCGVFATKEGEKVNNAIVVIESSKKNANDRIHCRRILTDSEKLRAEKHGIAQSDLQIISRDDCEMLFHLIPNGPLSFGAPPEVLKLFVVHPPLESAETGIVAANGLFTCNNNKFVKHFSAVPQDERHFYVPYDKGGGHKWYRTSDLLLHWVDNGQEIRKYRLSRGQAAALPGEAFYFQPGVTYSYIGTKGFAARMLTPQAVFDIASSAVFSSQLSNHYVLGWLNSSLVRCMLGILNPTINFQIGDVRRLPFAIPDNACERQIAAWSEEAVEMAKQIERLDSKSPQYQGRDLDGNDLQMLDHLINREAQIQLAIDKQIFELYQISAATQKKVLADPWVRGKSGEFGKIGGKNHLMESKDH